MRHGLGMKRALASAGGLAAILAIAISAAGAATPRISVEQVDTSRYPLITATVIVPGSEKIKNPVLELSEKGHNQTIETQTGGSSQAAIALALDVSRSMKGAPLSAARQAAQTFIQKKRPNDLVGIYSFGHTATPVQAPDTDKDVLGSALSGVPLDTVEGTALYDSIKQASRDLASEPTLTKVLVVLTDGDDTTKTTLADAIKVAKSAGVTVDAIAIGAKTAPKALKDVATATGGHVFAADRSAQGITQVYTQIAQEIRNTYRLQYTSHGDGVVPIEVSLKGYDSGVQSVDLRAPAAKIVAAGGTVSAISKRSSTGLALAIVIGLVVMGAVLLLMRQPRETILARRLDRYTTAERIGVARREKAAEGISLRNLLIRRGERSFGGSSYFKRIAGLLERADMPMRAAEFAAIQAGAAVGLFLVGFVLVGFIPALIGLDRRSHPARVRRAQEGRQAAPQLRGSARRHARRGGLVTARRPVLPAGDVDDRARRARPDGQGVPARRDRDAPRAPARRGAAGDGRAARVEELRVRRAGREHPAPGRRLALRHPRHGLRHRARPRAVRPQGQGPDRDGPRLGLRAGRHADVPVPADLARRPPVRAPALGPDGGQLHGRGRARVHGTRRPRLPQDRQLQVLRPRC